MNWFGKKVADAEHKVAAIEKKVVRLADDEVERIAKRVKELVVKELRRETAVVLEDVAAQLDPRPTG
jgi:DNA-binding transcriptional regulator YiaG